MDNKNVKKKIRMKSLQDYEGLDRERLIIILDRTLKILEKRLTQLALVYSEKNKKRLAARRALKALCRNNEDRNKKSKDELEAGPSGLCKKPPIGAKSAVVAGDSSDSDGSQDEPAVPANNNNVQDDSDNAMPSWSFSPISMPSSPAELDPSLACYLDRKSKLISILDITDPPADSSEDSTECMLIGILNLPEDSSEDSLESLLISILDLSEDSADDLSDKEQEKNEDASVPNTNAATSLQQQLEPVASTSASVTRSQLTSTTVAEPVASTSASTFASQGIAFQQVTSTQPDVSSQGQNSDPGPSTQTSPSTSTELDIALPPWKRYSRGLTAAPSQTQLNISAGDSQPSVHRSNEPDVPEQHNQATTSVNFGGANIFANVPSLMGVSSQNFKKPDVPEQHNRASTSVNLDRAVTTNIFASLPSTSGVSSQNNKNPDVPEQHSRATTNINCGKPENIFANVPVSLMGVSSQNTKNTDTTEQHTRATTSINFGGAVTTNIFASLPSTSEFSSWDYKQYDSNVGKSTKKKHLRRSSSMYVSPDTTYKAPTTNNGDVRRTERSASIDFSQDTLPRPQPATIKSTNKPTENTASNINTPAAQSEPNRQTPKENVPAKPLGSLPSSVTESQHTPLDPPQQTRPQGSTGVSSATQAESSISVVADALKQLAHQLSANSIRPNTAKKSNTEGFTPGNTSRTDCRFANDPTRVQQQLPPTVSAVDISATQYFRPPTKPEQTPSNQQISVKPSVVPNLETESEIMRHFRTHIQSRRMPVEKTPAEDDPLGPFRSQLQTTQTTVNELPARNEEANNNADPPRYRAQVESQTQQTQMTSNQTPAVNNDAAPESFMNGRQPTATRPTQMPANQTPIVNRDMEPDPLRHFRTHNMPSNPTSSGSNSAMPRSASMAYAPGQFSDQVSTQFSGGQARPNVMNPEQHSSQTSYQFQTRPNCMNPEQFSGQPSCQFQARPICMNPAQCCSQIPSQVQAGPNFMNSDQLTGQMTCQFQARPNFVNPAQVNQTGFAPTVPQQMPTMPEFNMQYGPTHYGGGLQQNPNVMPNRHIERRPTAYEYVQRGSSFLRNSLYPGAIRDFMYKRQMRSERSVAHGRRAAPRVQYQVPEHHQPYNNVPGFPNQGLETTFMGPGMVPMYQAPLHVCRHCSKPYKTYTGLRNHLEKICERHIYNRQNTR